MTSDRVALVTGTSAGLGAAVADVLLGGGWTVVGVARRTSAITNPRYRHLSLDLADADAIAKIEAAVAPLLGASTIARVALVNNAAAPGPLAPIEEIEPQDLARLYAVNVIAPVALMGLAVRRTPADAALRIVNVSSGAAVGAYPGLAAYSSSKAALRMAGMVLAAELESEKRKNRAPHDAAILSYEPGAVDTDMQTHARSLSPDVFPWVEMFHAFVARGILVPPAVPAAEIVRFVESDGHPRFSDARLLLMSGQS